MLFFADVRIFFIFSLFQGRGKGGGVRGEKGGHFYLETERGGGFRGGDPGEAECCTPGPGGVSRGGGVVNSFVWRPKCPPSLGCSRKPTCCQGRILAVWILAAKLPNSDLNFAVEFLSGFFYLLFLRALFKG